MLPERLDRELLHVVQSLCDIAAVWVLTGSAEKAACLIEQASDLLGERARQIAIHVGSGVIADPLQ